MTLALISGSTMLYNLLGLVVVGVCFWLILWLIDYCKLPEPLNKFAKILLAICCVVVSINFLLAMFGHGFISW